jgi:heme exporter protein A
MSFAGHSLACVRGERLVFEDLDFSLPPGGALVITGANGSGKTSLLRLAAGLATPAAGAFTWEGAAISESPEAHKARTAFVGHLDAVKPAFTALEDLRFWMRFRGEDGGAAAAEAALARFAIEALAEIPARLLSAGQRRRLALARLAAVPARLWLLDEPTVALDDVAVAALMSLVAEHRTSGGAVMVATHQALALEDTQILHLGGPGA